MVLNPRWNWDWAARPLEFAARDPLIRPFSQSIPSPIPTIASAEEQKRNLEKDLGTLAATKEMHMTMDELRDTRAPTIGGQTFPEDAPLTLNSLIVDTSARVRSDRRAHAPLATPPRGAAQQQISGDEQINRWICKGKGKEESPPDPIRGGCRIAPYAGTQTRTNSRKHS